MEISSFLDKKLARRFKTYDYDGNGSIERQDFHNAVVKMCEAFGHGPDSPARQRLYDLTMQLWQHPITVADANADGCISAAEYKQAFANGLLVTPETFEQGYIPFNEAIMAIADVDGDGRLNVEEEIRWTNALMNLPEAVARETFRRLDVDGDGYITTVQTLEAIREYYFNDDPQSTGSWLLGPLEA